MSAILSLDQYFIRSLTTKAWLRVSNSSCHTELNSGSVERFRWISAAILNDVIDERLFENFTEQMCNVVVITMPTDCIARLANNRAACR